MQKLNNQIVFAIVTITDKTGWEQEAIQSIVKQSYFKKENRNFHWFIVSPTINQKMLAFQHLCGDGKAQRITTIAMGDQFSFLTAMAKVVDLTDYWVYTFMHYDVSEALPTTALRYMVTRRYYKYKSGITFAKNRINLWDTATYSRAFLVKACAEAKSDEELLTIINKHKYVKTGALTT